MELLMNKQAAAEKVANRLKNVPRGLLLCIIPEPRIELMISFVPAG